MNASATIIFTVLFWGSALAAFVFWVFMLIDALRRQFKSDTEKLVWVFVIIFLHILGAVIYYFMVKRGSRKIAKFNTE